MSNAGCSAPGSRSIMTLTQAGLPLATARSRAGAELNWCSVTSSPWPPSACDDPVVSRREGARSRGRVSAAVRAKLNLVFRIPGLRRCRPPPRSEGRNAAPYRTRRHLEAEGAVAHHRHDEGPLGKRGTRGDRERNGRRRWNPPRPLMGASRYDVRIALRPLPDLAAVADQHSARRAGSRKGAGWPGRARRGEPPRCSRVAGLSTPRVESQSHGRPAAAHSSCSSVGLDPRSCLAIRASAASLPSKTAIAAMTL